MNSIQPNDPVHTGSKVDVRITGSIQLLFSDSMQLPSETKIHSEEKQTSETEPTLSTNRLKDNRPYSATES